MITAFVALDATEVKNGELISQARDRISMVLRSISWLPNIINPLSFSPHQAAIVTPAPIGSTTSTYRTRTYITGDKAYNDDAVEDALKEAGLKMSPLWKKNSQRPMRPWSFSLRSNYRKIVETAGSLIERVLPKSIHSVTGAGVELKVALFVLACSLYFLC
jgi:hypothetical protein